MNQTARFLSDHVARNPPWRVARMLALLVLAGAGVSFVAGWLCGVRPLMQPVETLPPVAPRTLFTFMVAAGAVLLRLYGAAGALSAAVALSVSGLAGLSAINLVWETVPWRSNRMAVTTELGFYTLSFVLLVYGARDRGFRRAAFWICLSGAVWSAPPVAGLLLGRDEVIRLAPWHAMAPQTAVFFLLLFLALSIGLATRRRRRPPLA